MFLYSVIRGSTDTKHSTPDELCSVDPKLYRSKEAALFYTRCWWEVATAMHWGSTFIESQPDDGVWFYQSDVGVDTWFKIVRMGT